MLVVVRGSSRAESTRTPSASALERREQPAPAPVTRGTSVAVGQLALSPAHPCTSVLGWDEFTLGSVLAFGGTALLSCRRNDDEPELSLVLLIGEDPRADDALTLLQTWQTHQIELRLRPTSTAGAIEVFAGRYGAVRAGLLAA
jgi:hypothetical protein